MFKCTKKITNDAKMYFVYDNKAYPICCKGCIKYILTKIITKKTIKSFKEEDLKDLEKVEKKVVTQKLKQAHMDLPKPKLKEKEKKKHKKSVKKKMN